MHKTIQIPLARIDVDKDHRIARNQILIAMIASYCLKHGDVPSPLHVYPKPNDRYGLMNGGTRLAAAAEAKLGSVSVIVRDTPLSDDELTKERVQENRFRQDFSIVEKGAIFEGLRVKNKWPQAQVAKFLEINELEVSRALAVFRNCTPKTRELVGSGKICGSIAVILSRLNDPAQQDALAAEVVSKNLIRRAVEGRVKSLLGKRERKPKTLTFPLGEGISLTIRSRTDYETLEACLKDALKRFRKGKNADDDDGPLYLPPNDDDEEPDGSLVPAA